MKNLKVFMFFAFIIIFKLVFVNNTFGQEIKFFGEDTVNIVYYSRNSNFPFKVNLSGTVLDFSNGTSCGVFNSSATLKILVESQTYPDTLIYVVANCLNFGNKLVGKKINFSAIGIKPNNKKVYHPIFNKFNSNGLPFYWISDKERDLIRIISDQ